ncbi:response regulator transcription factor [Patescibacteria group bacterium]|nr:response regulator transcription factor [Patescibacteria group bacterium]MBU4016616.1 response regulator transcription factor [Patescibacteria group bacterium]MBU4098377.1 response regulator transcription factor [Patescibacteria group bacterium]
MRVLIIEDERRLSSVIKKGLVEDGFAVDQAFDGEEGLFLARSEAYDLIILDLTLSKVDGMQICSQLRKKNIKTPIIMLTAKITMEDKIKGLDIGADDYMTKPFSFLELRSRIHALIRRSKQHASSQLSIADLEVDPLKHSVIRAGKQIRLTPKELAVLEFLMHHKQEVVSRTMILEHVWDYNFDGMSNIVDVFIATLRKKIDGGHKQKLIHTIHGVGYKIGEKGV